MLTYPNVPKVLRYPTTCQVYAYVSSPGDSIRWHDGKRAALFAPDVSMFQLLRTRPTRHGWLLSASEICAQGTTYLYLPSYLWKAVTRLFLHNLSLNRVCVDAPRLRVGVAHLRPTGAAI